MQNESSEYKYNLKDKKTIFNKGRSFGSVYEGDLKKILFDAEGFHCQNNVVYSDKVTREASDPLDFFVNQEYIDEQALIGFGESVLLNQLQRKCNGYSLSIPSKEIPYGSHAVAMMIDDENKRISYHDSHGEDMPKAMKDYLALLLPQHEIFVDSTKLQEDVKDFTPGNEQNDNSCALLTLYNLRDMWYKRSGRQDEVCQFNSSEAREDAWNKIKNTVKEPEVKSTKKFQVISKSNFSFGEKTTPQPWTEERKALGKQEQQRLMNYRLENEPDYQERLKQAVNTTRNNHQVFFNNLANQGTSRK